MGFPGDASGKNPPACAGYVRNEDLIPRLGRSPGGGHGIHSSILALRDRGTWWSTVHSVSKSWIRLKQLHTCTQGTWYHKTKDIRSKYYKLKKV